jgi:phospholipid-binding lipoprotein MlaA
MHDRINANVPGAVMLLVLFTFIATGCASIPGEPDPNDPWESFNRSMYGFNDSVDKAIVKPVSNVYLKIPQGGRTAVHNFFVNLGYPTTIINQFLQGKFERGFEDTMRFIFNTTLGLLGFIDIAGATGLPRHDEDFGQTFAVWGIPSGNFLTLPVLGPQTVRSTVGWPLDFVTKPLRWIDTPAEFWALVYIDIVDTRARLTPAIKLRDETAFDPYIFTREAFLQQRLNLIHDGDPPIQELEDLDFLDEESLLEEEQLLEEESSERNLQ